MSYVLVNWRTNDMLPRALKSIEDQTYRQREVFVVDNGSPGFEPEMLWPLEELTLIRNERNLGFAAANNQALQLCSGDVVVLLNCDAYLHPDFTSRAVDVFAASPHIGTVVPKILRDDLSGAIDSAGHLMYTDRTAAHRGGGELDQGQYDGGGFVFGGTAAAIAYRREMLQAVATPEGGEPPGHGIGAVFDESFFAYYEDVDLDWRANLAGWRAYYEPRCVAWHQGRGSGGRRMLAIRIQAEKNRYLMIAKNDSPAAQLAALGPLMAYECWHAVRILVRPWLWPAYALLLRHLPAAWRYRRWARAGRVITPQVVAAQFMPRGLQPPPKAEPPAPPFFPVLQDESGEPGESPFPLVSVLVVNHNGLVMTRRCLASLNAQSYAPLETILVDNGSSVNEAEMLAMEHPWLRTLRLERNHGFAGGVNWGVSLARGEYIVLVNNDAVLHPDCVRNLVYCAKRTGTPAVQGRLVNVRSEEEASAALSALDLEDEPPGGVVWDLPATVVEALAESRRNHGVSVFGSRVLGAYGNVMEGFFPSGALCVLRREAIAPLLPELLPGFYFLYHEDVWLGFRLRVAGGTVPKEPRACAVHVMSSTTQRMWQPRVRFYQERNRWLNLLAFLPGPVVLKLLPAWTLRVFVIALANLVRPAAALGYCWAHLWLLTHLPTVVRWRRQCRAAVNIIDEQWVSELSGQVQGAGGLANRLALAWCKALSIPCRELRKPRPPSGG